MDWNKCVAYLLVLLLVFIILTSDIYLATYVFNLMGLSWLIFIIIYFWFICYICRIIINLDD